MQPIVLAAGSRQGVRAAMEAVAPLAAETGAPVHLLGDHEPGWLDENEAGAPFPVRVLPATAPLAGAVARHARRRGARLVVFVPELRRGGGPVWLDPAAMHLASRVECAVLVLREGEPWPPEPARLPVGHAEARAGTLALARRWLRALRGAARDGDRLPWRLDVLHVARSAAEWHDTEARLSGEAGSHAETSEVRRMSCMRFGAEPRRRVLDWLRAESGGLLVLGRPGASAAGGRDGEPPDWLRIFADARGPVLLLPARGPGEPALPGGDGRPPAWRRLAGWLRYRAVPVPR